MDTDNKDSGNALRTDQVLSVTKQAWEIYLKEEIKRICAQVPTHAHDHEIFELYNKRH